MPLEELFTRPIDALRAFVQGPSRALGLLTFARAQSSVVERLLAGMAGEEGPDVWRCLDGSCREPLGFLRAGLERLERSHEAEREALGAMGIDLPRATGVGPGERRLLAYAGAVRDALQSPDARYVIVVDPAAESDCDAVCELARRLATAPPHLGVQVLLLDRRAEGDADPSPLARALAELAPERLCRVAFDIGPEAIEAQVQRDLARPGVPSLTRAGYLAMAASFCRARGQLGPALEMQSEALARHAEAGSEGLGQAAYELGTLRLAAGQQAREAGRSAEAADHFEAAERALSQCLGSALGEKAPEAPGRQSRGERAVGRGPSGGAALAHPWHGARPAGEVHIGPDHAPPPSATAAGARREGWLRPGASAVGHGGSTHATRPRTGAGVAPLVARPSAAALGRRGAREAARGGTPAAAEQASPRQASSGPASSGQDVAPPPLPPLASLCLTHLAVTQSRRGRESAAQRTFEVAVQSFRARGDVAGEVFALDSQAGELALAGRTAEAQRAWRDALARLDRLGEDHWTELRERGRADIEGKLAGLSSRSSEPPRQRVG